MINQEIFQTLKRELNVSQATLYRMLKKIKKGSGYLITLKEAAYLLASEQGIDVLKLLDEKQRERLMTLKQHQKVEIKPQKIEKKIIRKEYVLKLGSKSIVKDPLLSKKIYDDSSDMTEVYQLLYIFENSVRNFITRVLSNKHGSNWWDNKVSVKVRGNVNNRKAKEKQIPWHGRRGAHPLFYTNIDDLKSIITSNWSDFQSLLPNQEWIKVLIGVIEPSRNVVAHNNPLHKDDIERIKVNFRDWNKQLNAIKDKL